MKRFENGGDPTGVIMWKNMEEQASFETSSLGWSGEESRGSLRHAKERTSQGSTKQLSTPTEGAPLATSMVQVGFIPGNVCGCRDSWPMRNELDCGLDIEHEEAESCGLEIYSCHLCTCIFSSGDSIPYIPWTSTT